MGKTNHGAIAEGIKNIWVKDKVKKMRGIEIFGELIYKFFTE
jgi:hypothetical protein